jgi:hypothetical protein
MSDNIRDCHTLALAHLIAIHHHRAATTQRYDGDNATKGARVHDG